MLNRFDWNPSFMFGRPDGEYVEYAEVAPLIKELEHLREEVQSLREEKDEAKSRQLGEFQVAVDVPELERHAPGFYICSDKCPLHYKCKFEHKFALSPNFYITIPGPDCVRGEESHE